MAQLDNEGDESTTEDTTKIIWEDATVSLEKVEPNHDRGKQIHIEKVEYSEHDKMDEEKKEYEYLNARKAIRKAFGCGAGTELSIGSIVMTLVQGSVCVATTVATVTEAAVASDAIAVVVFGSAMIGASSVAATSIGVSLHSGYTYWSNRCEQMKFDKTKNYNDKVDLFTTKLKEIKEVESKIEQKRLQLIAQEEKLNNSEFMVERLEIDGFFDTKVVVCVGPCGYGKSVVCNRLLGDTQTVFDLSEMEDAMFSVAEIGDTKSHTKTLQKQFKNVILEHHTERKAFRLSVVDTQGAFDSNGNDEHHQNELAEYFKACGGINMFCIFFKFGAKIDVNYKRLLNLYTGFWGKDIWKHCVVIITNCDKDSKLNIKRLGKGLPKTMEQIKAFLNEISDGLCDDVPIYEFGEHNFEISTSNILMSLMDEHAIYHNKYKCDNIRSPVDVLYDEIKPLIIKWCVIHETLKRLSNEINDAQNKIN